MQWCGGRNSRGGSRSRGVGGEDIGVDGGRDSGGCGGDSGGGDNGMKY